RHAVLGVGVAAAGRVDRVDLERGWEVRHRHAAPLALVRPDHVRDARHGAGADVDADVGPVPGRRRHGHRFRAVAVPRGKVRGGDGRHTVRDAGRPSRLASGSGPHALRFGLRRHRLDRLRPGRHRHSRVGSGCGAAAVCSRRRLAETRHLAGHTARQARTRASGARRHDGVPNPRSPLRTHQGLLSGLCYVGLSWACGGEERSLLDRRVIPHVHRFGPPPPGGGPGAWMLESAILADYHFLGGASLSADTEKGEFLMSNRYRLAALAAVVAMLAVPSAVTASHTFVDVRDSNVHHDDITWLQNAGVTRGCNPPANTEFCPDEPVLRQEMASFMRRLAEKRVVDAATVAGLTPGEIAHGYARKGATEAGSLNGVRKLEEIRITVPADGYLQLSGAASFRDDDGGSMLVWLQ